MDIEEAKECLRIIIREQNEPDDVKSVNYINAMESIETVLQELDNSISKDKIKEKRININQIYKEIERKYTEEQLDKGEESFDDYVEFQKIQYAYNILDELLEDK